VSLHLWWVWVLTWFLFSLAEVYGYAVPRKATNVRLQQGSSRRPAAAAHWGFCQAWQQGAAWARALWHTQQSTWRAYSAHSACSCSSWLWQADRR
jgi:hypothetical protein